MALQHLLSGMFHGKENAKSTLRIMSGSILSRLTLGLQHLEGGLGSSPRLPLGFGQGLPLPLKTVPPLLFLLLLLLLALLL